MNAKVLRVLILLALKQCKITAENITFDKGTVLPTVVCPPENVESVSTPDVVLRKHDIQVVGLAGTIVLAVFILPMGVFGLGANGITACVLFRAKSFKSIFNYFLLSMAISDLISALISPLTVYHQTWGFNHWNFPALLCKVYQACKTGTSILTSMHITAFAALRFVSLMWPHKFSLYSHKHAKITILALWIIAFVAGVLPFFVWTSALKVNRLSWITMVSQPSCTVSNEWNFMASLFALYGHPIFFIVPYILVFIFCGGTAFIICSRRMERAKGRRPGTPMSESEIIRQQKENQAICQLFLICGSFFFGYIPRCASHIHSSLVRSYTKESNLLKWWWESLALISLQLSECLNPIFYNLASSKMRQETKTFLFKLCGISVASGQDDEHTTPVHRRIEYPPVNVTTGTAIPPTIVDVAI